MPKAGRHHQSRENYWIVDKDEIVALVSPVRQDLLDRLCDSGPLSVSKLARALAMRPSALYRHLEILLDAGLVVIVGERRANRRTEKIYASRARRLRLERAFGDPCNGEELAQVFASLSRQLERDVRRAMKSENARPSGPSRNLAFGRIIGTPSPAELAAINAKIEEISKILRKISHKDRSLVSFGWALAPLQRGEP